MDTSKKTAVVYHYYEADLLYKENLVFFLATAIEADVDYYIIIAGDCSIALPTLPNVTYIYTENRNNDYGGYAHFMHEHYEPIYDYIVFINSSVRGPFLVNYYDQSWLDVFINRLEGNVQLVGISINDLPQSSKYTQLFHAEYGYDRPYAHVQTTAYALTKKALGYLIDLGFYDTTETLSKANVIVRYELRLSQEIVRQGWEIAAVIPNYSENEGSTPYVNPSTRRGDVLFFGGYFHRTLNPAEAVFIKTNRNMVTRLQLASSTCTSLLSNLEKVGRFPEARALLDRQYQSLTRNKLDIQMLSRLLKHFWKTTRNRVV